MAAKRERRNNRGRKAKMREKRSIKTELFL